jgi:hypothetical protein
MEMTLVTFKYELSLHLPHLYIINNTVYTI